MKVMLLTPPYHAGVVESAGTWMNLAFAYLAGELRAAGHQVEIHDAMSRFIDQAAVADLIQDRRPDVVALTAITASYPACVEVCDAAKKIDPAITTVLGNVHPTFMWKDVLTSNSSVDFVVRGEGEKTLVELCACLVAGDQPSKVAGLAYRKEGQMSCTPARPRVPDLDSLETAWDLIEWPLYSYRPSPEGRLAIVSSSRGCQQQCSFCSQQKFWEQTWRGRDPLKFITELEHLRDTHDVRVAMLSDETPTVEPERWQKILDLAIERELGVELLMETRVDDILRDEKILEKYVKAGISHIYVGVESGDQATLDLMKKDTQVEQGKRAIDLINKHGMVSETSFVLGMPTDTAQSIADTVELAKHYAPDLAFFLAVAPWPYADLYETLKPFVEVFDYSRYNLVEAVMAPAAISIDEVNTALHQASRDFYMHKMKNLDRLSPPKRQFMIKVMRLMMDHSYLGEQMREVAGEMPAEARQMMARLRESQ